jgi:hypothetical protein
VKVTITHEFDDEAIKRLRHWYANTQGWTKHNGGRALIKAFVRDAIDDYWGNVDSDESLWSEASHDQR